MFEAVCFKLLDRIFSAKFYVFPQMYFSKRSGLSIKRGEQDSADFVFCDKDTLEVLCLIECGEHLAEGADDRLKPTFEVDDSVPIIRIEDPTEMTDEQLIKIVEKTLNNA